MRISLSFIGQFKTRSIRLLPVLLFALAFSPFAAQAQVRVGALLPLTGDVSSIGLTASAVIQLAEQHYEAVFDDEEIEVVVRDTEADPQKALQYIQELHEEGVRAFVGPFTSACVLAVQSYVNENELLIVSPSSTSLALAQDDSIYRLVSNDGYNVEAFLNYFENQGIESIALLYRDDVYGASYIEIFQSRAQEYGVTILGQSGYSVGATDYSESLQSLRDDVQTGVDAYGADKTAVLAVSLDELGPIMKEASQVDGLSQVQWFASESSKHLTELSEDESVAAFADRTRFTYAAVSVQNIYHPKYPHNHEYSLALAQIEERMDTTPQTDVAAFVYDSFCLAVHAEKLADSMGGLKPAVEYASQVLFGLSLFVFFDENGDRANNVVTFNRFSLTDEGSKWIIVGSYSKDVSNFGIYDPFYYYEYDLEKTERSITIGALLSLTGSSATVGKSIEKTLDIAAQNITTYLKREFAESSEINIVVADTASDPQTALAQLKELHEQGIDTFVGPITSEELKAVADYANENQIFLLSPSSTSLDMAKDDTIFRFALDNGKLANAAAAFMLEEGVTFVQPVYRSDAYGDDFYQAFQKAAEDLGLVCGEGIAYDPNAFDPSATAAALNDGVHSAVETYGAEKTSVLSVSYDEAVDLFNAIPQSSPLREIRWFGSDGLLLNSSIVDDPGAREFAIETGFAAFGPGNLTYVPTDIFGYSIRRQIRDRIGTQPGAYDYIAYDAAWQLTLFSLKKTFPGMEGADLKEVFIDLASSIKVGFEIYDLNEYGDSNFGFCDFYTVTHTDETSNWNNIARYSYHLNYEGLDYIQTGDPGTTVGDWSVY